MTDNRRIHTILKQAENSVAHRQQVSVPLRGLNSAATVYLGDVSGAFTSSDSTFTVDGLVKLGGPVTITDSSVTVQNTFDWDGDDNGKCMIIWNQTDRQWEAIQVACTS